MPSIPGYGWYPNNMVKTVLDASIVDEQMRNIERGTTQAYVQCTHPGCDLYVVFSASLPVGPAVSKIFDHHVEEHGQMEERARYKEIKMGLRTPEEQA